MIIDKNLIITMEKKAQLTTNDENIKKTAYVTDELQKIFERLGKTQESITEMVKIIQLAYRYHIEEIGRIVFINDKQRIKLCYQDNNPAFVLSEYFNVPDEVTIRISEGLISIDISKMETCRVDYYKDTKQNKDLNPIPDFSKYISTDKYKINMDNIKFLYKKVESADDYNNVVGIEKKVLESLNNLLDKYESFERDINAAMVEYTSGENDKNEEEIENEN